MNSGESWRELGKAKNKQCEQDMQIHMDEKEPVGVADEGGDEGTAGPERHYTHNSWFWLKGDECNRRILSKRVTWADFPIRNIISAVMWIMFCSVNKKKSRKNSHYHKPCKNEEGISLRDNHMVERARADDWFYTGRRVEGCMWTHLTNELLT